MPTEILTGVPPSGGWSPNLEEHLANQYIVDLTAAEQEYLGCLIKRGSLQHAKWHGPICYSTAGRNRWTMQLLADGWLALQLVEAVSDEPVRRVLKKHPEAMAARRVVPPQCRAGTYCGK